jgi:predicted methyltransferase
MRRALVFIASCLLAANVLASETAPANDVVTAALANPARSDADRERDGRDHPKEVLALTKFGPGMTVADIFGGGGYYSEIIAGVVGPEGQVLLINNPPYDAFAKKGVTTRLADNRLPNVRYEITPTEVMGLGEGTLDGALIVMSYHDLYVTDVEGGWPAVDASQFIDQIVTGLKSGGELLIVDHQARLGTGKGDAQELHRIEDSFAIEDFKAHGLEFVGSIDVLRNTADDHSLGVFNPEIRGKTDRFVQLYRKP